MDYLHPILAYAINKKKSSFFLKLQQWLFSISTLEKAQDDRNEDPNCRTYCWDMQSIKEVNLASKPCNWRLWPLKMDQWTTTQNFYWVHFDGVDLHNARRYAFNFNLHVNSWPTKMILSLLETAIDNMWILASEEQGWRVIAFRLAPEDTVLSEWLELFAIRK